MTAHPHSFAGVYDDAATHIMGAAYRLACTALDADGDGVVDRTLRSEIAAALLEAAGDDLSDPPTLAQAAIELVYVDAIEIDFIKDAEARPSGLAHALPAIDDLKPAAQPRLASAAEDLAEEPDQAGE